MERIYRLLVKIACKNEWQTKCDRYFCYFSTTRLLYNSLSVGCLNSSVWAISSKTTPVDNNKKFNAFYC